MFQLGEADHGVVARFDRAVRTKVDVMTREEGCPYQPGGESIGRDSIRATENRSAVSSAVVKYTPEILGYLKDGGLFALLELRRGGERN